MNPTKPKKPTSVPAYPPRINTKQDYDNRVKFQKVQIDTLVKANKAPGRVVAKKKVKF